MCYLCSESGGLGVRCHGLVIYCRLSSNTTALSIQSKSIVVVCSVRLFYTCMSMYIRMQLCSVKPLLTGTLNIEHACLQRIPYSGNAWRRESLANLANKHNSTKLKPSKCHMHIKQQLDCTPICRTFFAKTFINSILPNIITAKHSCYMVSSMVHIQNHGNTILSLKEDNLFIAVKLQVPECPLCMQRFHCIWN